MREIKFRVKYKNTWYYGSFVKMIDLGESYEIYQEETQSFCLVEKETIGQFTGLKDKNGVEIYEGDIVEVSNFNFSTEIGKVEWNNEIACFRIVGHLFDDSMGIHTEDIEVIGNIYDNPELLEVKE